MLVRAVAFVLALWLFRAATAKAALLIDVLVWLVGSMVGRWQYSTVTESSLWKIETTMDERNDEQRLNERLNNDD